MLIYFGSGMASLVDEVIWIRLLKLTLGNTVYASSIVVSMFMAGLALGALLMSRFADRVRRPLRLYAALELLATVSALSLPLTLDLADQAYRWFFQRFTPSREGLLGLQVLVSGVILLVPTMVMGSTLPLLGRFITTLREQIGWLVGRLYTINTLGAAAGCFLAGFVLIRTLGVIGTLLVAAAVNLIVAISGWTLSTKVETSLKGKPILDPAPATGRAQTAPPVGSKASAARDRFSILLMVAFFMSGLISIGYELVWMRAIVIPLGGYTYVFAAVLTIYLIGNVIGAGIGSRLTRRVGNPATAFGVTLSILGLFGLALVPQAVFWLIDPGPLIAAKIFGSAAQEPSFRAVGLPLIFSGALFLLPSITMGIGFPLALQAWSQRRHRVGETTGTVYAVNTIGAVTGGLLAGFVLVPHVGTQSSGVILGLLGLGLGGLTVLVSTPATRRTFRWVYVAAVLGLAASTLLLPGELFVRRIVSTPGSQTLEIEEGVTTTVAVKRDAGGTLTLTSDGVHVAGDGLHRSAQKMLGHLAILLNPEAREVLSVGFGGGETTYCLSRHDLEYIRCVEIAPEVTDLALRHFNHINLGERLGQFVDLTYADAKNYLRMTTDHFDAIINDADIPSYSGSAPLFGKEHFMAAREHLAPGGLVVSKLHLTGIPVSSFDSILGTFSQVFPHVSIWFPTTKPLSFFYLVGSADEQCFAPKRIDEILQQDSVRVSTEYMHWYSSLDLAMCYIGDLESIRQWLTDFDINSDRMPYVEFNLAQHGAGMLDVAFDDFLHVVRRPSLLQHVCWDGFTAEERDHWTAAYEQRYEAAGHMLENVAERDAFELMRHTLAGLKILPDHPSLLEAKAKMLMAAEDGIEGGYARAILNRMREFETLFPESEVPPLVSSWAALSVGLIDEALAAAERALAASSDDVRVRTNLAEVYRARGDFAAAMEQYEEALRIDSESYTALNDLAWMLATRREAPYFDPGKAVRLAERACMLTGDTVPRFLDTRAVAYAAAGRFSEAVQSARHALNLARHLHRDDLSRRVEEHLQLFEQGRPFVETDSSGSAR